MDTSRGFMDSAWRLISTKQGLVPTVFDLRGAVVFAYYAVFHRLAELCSEELVGEREKYVRSSRAWNEYYRSLSHSDVSQACLRGKPDELHSELIGVFSTWFPNLQSVRNICSYEALVEPTLEEASSALNTAEECIDCLDKISEDQRRDFVAWVMLDHSGGVKQRRSKDFASNPSFFRKFKKRRVGYSWYDEKKCLHGQTGQAYFHTVCI